MLDNLDHLVIKPAFPSKGMEPVFGGKLAGDERSRLIERIKGTPARICRTGIAEPVHGTRSGRKKMVSRLGALFCACISPRRAIRGS